MLEQINSVRFIPRVFSLVSGLGKIQTIKTFSFGRKESYAKLNSILAPDTVQFSKLASD